MKKFIVFILLASLQAKAYIICTATCTGKTAKIIDQARTYYQNEIDQFKTSCEKRGGEVQASRAGALDFGFDQMGCFKMENFSYCVVYENREATGVGLTQITKANGGGFTASNGADESCRLQLASASCGKSIRAQDIKIQNLNCEEKP